MQRKHKYHLILLSFCTIISCTIFSCTISPDFSEVPELSFVGLSKDSMRQNNLLTDSIFVFFDFKDGDGDIGVGVDENRTDLVFRDNRDGKESNFKLPLVPFQGASNGIEGRVQIKVYTTCCIFDNSIPPCESPPGFESNILSWDIYLTDQAGNVSNVITTTPIMLLCD